MSQENQGNNSTVPTTVLPVKRGRGRPRKYENLPRGEVVSIPSRSDREKRQRRSRIDSIAHADSLFVGQIVSGVLDGVFDAGYLLTVRIGDTDTILRGVVFKPGLSVPIMAENDIAPHVRMFTRSEVPLPAVDSMITRSEVPPPAAERTFTRSEVTPPAADRTFTRSEVTPPAADRTFTRSEGPPSAADRTFARSEVPPQAADRQNQVSVSTVPSGPHIWQPVKLIPVNFQTFPSEHQLGHMMAAPHSHSAKGPSKDANHVNQAAALTLQAEVKTEDLTTLHAEGQQNEADRARLTLQNTNQSQVEKGKSTNKSLRKETTGAVGNANKSPLISPQNLHSGQENELPRVAMQALPLKPKTENPAEIFLGNESSYQTGPSNGTAALKGLKEKKASPKGGPALETQVPNLNGPAQKEMFFANDFTSYARGNMH